MKGRAWPWFLGLLLLGPVAMNGWVLAKLSNDSTFAVEDDYYRKAVTWDDHMAQAGRNTHLGWKAAATATRAPGQGIRLQFVLTDTAGRPVTGAQVNVLAFHNARAGLRDQIAAIADGTGYRADLKLDQPGLHEVRLTAQRGEQVFTQVLRVDVP
ncbi:MAG: FixH family protein [Myxococcota bacterium]